ncbi:hypothetical protein DPMN_027288 [Dreissena polymorpha]|uniref:Uncharacterized protein n=1 Tax=Dreissena polymorpha TaxID=45954 RepID=A0A9D4RF38_DREPO|nr:hypothetical protein DPMN_027288 [Dreissena polymorpha]
MLEEGYPSTDFGKMEVKELDKTLQKFNASVQGKEGRDNSKSALTSIRAGINRHLILPPVVRQMNLMKDRDFMFSNQVCTGLIKRLKREGRDKSSHKEPISEKTLPNFIAVVCFQIKLHRRCRTRLSSTL